MTIYEESYVAQGYVPPDNLPWDSISESRKRWSIPDHLVPVAICDGTAWAWGVPIINGKFLKHDI